ncbi:MAG: hypothetical protein ACYC27_03225 [Armatimonadota bacterium]
MVPPDQHDDTQTQLKLIAQHLESIDKSLVELKPLCVSMAVLENRVDTLEKAPNHSDKVHEHEPTLADHKVRIETCEKSINTLFDRSWQIIAGGIMAMFVAGIGIIASYFKSN